MAIERNHDVERLYMEQLRNIETSIYSFNKEKTWGIPKIKELRTPFKKMYNPETPTIGDALHRATGYDELGQIGGIIVSFISSFIIFAIASLGGIFSILNLVGWICIIVSLAWAAYLVWKTMKEKEQLERYYYNKVAENDRINKRNDEQLKRDLVSADNLEKRLAVVDSSLSTAVKIREDLYSINWIPNRYRNIQVIYYIYDMVSTSDISIEEALKYYLLQEANNKLDEVLKKLDNIIENQQEIIMNQAMIQSQNAILINDNKKMISNLSQIEENTRLASDYAQIGARYSEATAYFSGATYMQLVSK